MSVLHTLWFGYFYPSIKGNGPEDVFFGTIIGFGGSKIKNSLHKKITENHARALKEQSEVLMRHHEEQIVKLHEKIDKAIPAPRARKTP
jgi:hypothetical protein